MGNNAPLLAASDQISPRKCLAQPTALTAWGTGAYPLALPLGILLLGFLLRIFLAHAAYLNADEALIYFISAQPSLTASYRAGLISAHPPLYYVLLHYWRLLGSSEVMLRLPSVLAGTVFCWLGFKWLGRIAGPAAALVGLIFFCFTPALVSLGAEVRQYSLLLLFLAACLYFLERALQESSARHMAPFSISLWLAILTQYSAWMFCLAVGIYALWRFRRIRPNRRMLIAWATGQAVALGIYGVLCLTQFPWLFQVAAVDRMFQGQSRLGSLPRESFRLFHYLFSQPVVGGAVLVLFLTGIIRLFRRRTLEDSSEPSVRQLAWLLLMPFLFAWAAALARLYPFDGTRHSIVLAVFVIAGASLGLTANGRTGSWVRPLFLAALLTACYAFARPLGSYIKPRNQSRQWMAQAVDYARRSALPGSLFLVDDQSSYLFRYYFCRGQSTSFTEARWPFRYYNCSGYRLTRSSEWMITPGQLDTDLRHALGAYHVHPGNVVWLFQAGWNVDREPALVTRLRDYGCQPRRFGENILLCRMKIQ